MTAPTPVEPLRLSAAGDAKPAWITLLTTEHYNLQTQRAATIGEANGRASIFLGALSAGLVAIGFQGTSGGRSAGKTVFEVLVLSSLALLGLITYLRCVEISIDDWQFSQRISGLRSAYSQLVPELASLLSSAVGDEQFVAMLTPRRSASSYCSASPAASASSGASSSAPIAVFSPSDFTLHWAGQLAWARSPPGLPCRRRTASSARGSPAPTTGHQSPQRRDDDADENRLRPPRDSAGEPGS